MRTSRWSFVIPGALLALAESAGCGLLPSHPVAGAVTGLTLGGRGQPVLVVAVCRGTYDAVVYARELDGDSPSASSGAVATSTSHTTDFAADFGADPGPGWRVEQPVEPVKPGVRYFAYGAVTGSRWTALPVSFTTTTIEGLSADRVTWDRSENDESPATEAPSDWMTPPATGFSARDNFHRDACAVVGDD